MVNCSHCDHFIIESLCFTPETNIILYVNYNSINTILKPRLTDTENREQNSEIQRTPGSRGGGWAKWVQGIKRCRFPVIR